MIVTKKNACVGVALLFGCVLQQALCAQSLSLNISQLDTSSAVVNATSRTFEGLVMDYLFDSGLIVSNFPIEAEHTASKTDFSSVLSDAADGSLDYVVTVVLFFEVPPTTAYTVGKGKSQIKSAEWKLYQVRDWNMVSSGTLVKEGGFISADEKVLADYAFRLGKSIVDGIR
ncbi:MAG: hypothetical protein Ta2A_26100 [Treponemataceae bacterium]|nr:MAG: hypothetical protein Ta2A_26100 [Treponemataceae bacterium]